jgi:hypothetical protein
MLENKLTYSSDASIGTPWEPYVIKLSTNGIRTITSDDANDTEWYTLQGFKIGHRPTTPGIYIRGPADTVVH